MSAKFLLSLSLGLMLALAAPLSHAQAPAIPQEMLDAFAKEAPLAQADIDNFIKLAPQSASVAADPAKASDLLKSSGWTEARFLYVSTKIGSAMPMAMGMKAEDLQLDKLPEVMRPTEAEVTLVKDSLPALQEAMMKAAQPAQK